MVVCLYWANDLSAGLFRAAWLMPLAFFGYAFALTRSRGGFLGMLLALLTFLGARFGLKKALPLAGLVLPVMFLLFAGRQTSFSTSGGTGQQRIQIWVEGVGMFRQNPVFGIGFNQFVDLMRIEAHNSFLAVFVDLGFFGGSLFLGIFVYSLWALNHLGSGRAVAMDPELLRFRPYLMAIVAGYFGGMMTISRAYIIPTYMIAGLVTAFFRGATFRQPFPSLRLNTRLLGRLVFAGASFMVLIYLYTRSAARWGG
jgi:O-antigen ligase